MTGHESKIPGILKYNSRRQGNGGVSGDLEATCHIPLWGGFTVHCTMIQKVSEMRL